MRFHEDGPSIPNELLQDQKLGKVIFICGAGVSKQAKLPNFKELTRHVLDEVNADDDSNAVKYFNTWLPHTDSVYRVPFDAIYSELYKEYGKEYISSIIASHLLKLEADVSNYSHFHDIITISSCESRKIQIATTNFDRLLECALSNKSKITVCPKHSHNDSISLAEGIVYLHGRIRDANDDRQHFVLSKRDFGKAYLVDGFTLNLLKFLINNYSVVFIGYQIGDPIVQYLFEGLLDSNNDVRRKLYMFIDEKSSKSFDSWDNLGVNPIVYKEPCDLWKTIGCWANSIRNTSAYNENTLQLAKRSPRELLAFERGQVAYFLSTIEGSSSAHKQNISTEWLLVLDGIYRSGSSFVEFSSLNQYESEYLYYSLDDDAIFRLFDDLPDIDKAPPQFFSVDYVEQSPEERRETPFFDIFCKDPSRYFLKPYSLNVVDSLLLYSDSPSDQQIQIFNWISENLNNPLTAWWILWRGFSNKYLYNKITEVIDNNDHIDDIPRTFWKVILRHMYQSLPAPGVDYFHNILLGIKNSRWDGVSLGMFASAIERFIYPTIAPSCLANFPPDKLSWNSILLLFDEYWDKCSCNVFSPIPPPPSEYLFSVFAILESFFFCCYSVRRDLQLLPKSYPTCCPGVEYIGGVPKAPANALFQLFVNVIIEFSKNNREVLLARVSQWPQDDLQYFNKIQLHLMTNQNLYKINDVCFYILSMSHEHFWSRAIRRELLSLIASSWSKFPLNAKNCIINRFLSLPYSDSTEEQHIFSGYSRATAAKCLVWLVKNGVNLSSEQDSVYRDLPHKHTKDSSEEIPDDLGHGAHLVTDVYDLGSLLDKPVNNLEGIIENEDFFDFRTSTRAKPFAGLARSNPRKALAFLTTFARINMYPAVLWTSLFSTWPSVTDIRLNCVLVKRIMRIPKSQSASFVRPLSEWFDRYFAHLIKIDSNLAWQIYEYIIDLLQTIERSPSLKKHRVFVSSEDSSDENTYRFEVALNSEIGRVIHGIFLSLPSMIESNTGKIPDELLLRLSNLISLDGSLGQHSTSMLCHKFVELLSIANDWAMTYLDPCFDKSHPNTCFAWSGLLTSKYFPPTESDSHVYKNLIHTLTYDQYHIDVGRLSERSAKCLILLWSDKKYLEVNLQESDFRKCLRGTSTHNRSSAIYQLSGSAPPNSDTWINDVLPFIKNVWPKNKICRNPQESETWLYLLSKTGVHFPKIFEAVKHLLVPIEEHSTWLWSYQNSESDELELFKSYPAESLEMLDLVIPNDSKYLPYGLEKALESIVRYSGYLRKDKKFIRLHTMAD